MEKNRRGGLLFSKIVKKCAVTSSGACGVHDPSRVMRITMRVIDSINMWVTSVGQSATC